MLAKASPFRPIEMLDTLLGIGVSHAQVAGWSAVANADVIVFEIDDNGMPAGAVLVSTTTDVSGTFTLNLPVGTPLASNLVMQISNPPGTPVAVGTANVLTLPVTDTTLDLTPATEAGFRALITQAMPLANYTNDEINQFATLLQDLVGEFPPPPGTLEGEIASIAANLGGEMTLALNAISGAGTGAPVIVTTTLPDGTEGVAYSKTLRAIGGTAPLSFGLATGSPALPAGLSLVAASGQLSGTPAANGMFSFTFEVSDQSMPAQTGAQMLNLNIAAAPAVGFLARVSVSSNGTEGNGSSPAITSGYGRPNISRNGQFIIFSSQAENLVAGDTNQTPDAFIRDICRTGAGPIGGCGPSTVRVSGIDSAGDPAFGSTGAVNISGLGAWAVFQTDADLVPDDGSDQIMEPDLYRVSSAGSAPLWISEGRKIGGAQVGAVGIPSASNDGQFVAWSEFPNNGTPAVTDSALVIRNVGLAPGQERVIALGTGGLTQDPVMSDDRQVLAFMTTLGIDATDTNQELDLYIADLAGAAPAFTRVSQGGAQILDPFFALQYGISSDGNRIVYASNAAETAGDTNGFQDIFVYDRVAGTRTLVSVTPAGGPADGPSFDPSISADGNSVAFASATTNLVANDSNGQTDVFVRNLVSGQTRRLSVSQIAPGAENGRSDRPAINGDGTLVAFVSLASNLIVGDANNVRDVFVAQ